MHDNSVKELKRYYNHLKNIRGFWENGVWQDISENLSPQREDFQDVAGTKGKRKATKIYDSSPMIYLNTFADGLHGNLMSPAMLWFIFRLPGQFKFLETIPEVKFWLQEAQELMYYFLAESNFYSVMRQYLKYGGSFGTASLAVEEDKGNNKLVFYCLHPKECFIAENQFGRVDVVFRKIRMTARQMKQKFPRATFSPAVLKALSGSGNPLTEFDVIHAVYPNDEYDNRKIGNRHMAFASKYFEFKSRDNGGFLSEKGYEDFPYMIWRYFKGEPGPYGDSPAVFALPEIMGLQAMRKSLLRAGEMASDPPYNVPSDQEGMAKIKPGGMNYYGTDFNRRIYPLNSGINYPIGIESVKDSREILKQHYHVNTFLTMQDSKDRVKTAQEVFELKSEQAMILGASIGDLKITKDSILDYVFGLKLSTGQIPQPPPVLLQHMGGRRIPIEYMGPLAQAQKRMFETRGIMDSLQTLAPIFEIFPDIVDNFNSDVIAKKIMASHMYPQEAFNAPETIEQIRQGRAIQNEEEQKKVDMDRMAEFLKKFAQADKNSGGKLWDALETVMGGGMGMAPQGLGVPAIA